MATRTLATIVAATTLLAACASPYADALKTSLTACQSGDRDACRDASTLDVQDKQWHAEENEKVGNVVLGILGTALIVGAAVAGAYAPPPPPPPHVILGGW